MSVASNKGKKSPLDNSKNEKDALSTKLQPTAEQIRIAQLINPNRVPETEMQSKVEEIMEMTGKSRDAVIIALHDYEDPNAAIESLFDDKSTEGDWEVSVKKKKNRPQQQQQQSTATGETKTPTAETNGTASGSELNHEDKGQRTHSTERGGRDQPSFRRRGGLRGSARGGPPRMNRGGGGGTGRNWRAKETEKNLHNLEEHGPQPTSNNTTAATEGSNTRGGRGGRFRGGRGQFPGSRGSFAGGRGRGRSRTFQNRSLNSAFPQSIDTWNNNTGTADHDKEPTLNVGNWADFAASEDLSEEDWTGSLSETKVFTPSINSAGGAAVPCATPPKVDLLKQHQANSSTSSLSTQNSLPTVEEAAKDLPAVQQPPNQFSMTEYAQHAAETIKAAVGIPTRGSTYPPAVPKSASPPSQPPRVKPQRPRTVTKIPESPVEMPDGGLGGLELQFDTLEFGTGENPYNLTAASESGGPLKIGFMSSSADQRASNQPPLAVQQPPAPSPPAPLEELQSSPALVEPHHMPPDPQVYRSPKTPSLPAPTNDNSTYVSPSKVSSSAALLGTSPGAGNTSSYLGGTSSVAPPSTNYSGYSPQALYSSSPASSVSSSFGITNQPISYSSSNLNAYTSAPPKASPISGSNMMESSQHYDSAVSSVAVSSVSGPAVYSTASNSYSASSNYLSSTTSSSTSTTSVLKTSLSASKTMPSIATAGPAMLGHTPYIMSQPGLPFYNLGPSMYSMEDIQLLQSRMSQMQPPFYQGYYDMPFAGAPRDPTVAYTGSTGAEGRYNRGGDSDGSSIATSLSGQAGSTNPQTQPYLNAAPTLPPGYGFYFASGMMPATHYPHTMFPVPPSATTPNTQYPKPGTYGSQSYNSAYDGLAQNTADFTKSSYGSGAQGKASSATLGGAAGDLSVYGKSTHPQLAKSFDKPGFHTGTPPPPFPQGVSSTAYTPAPYIGVLAHGQHPSPLLHHPIQNPTASAPPQDSSRGPGKPSAPPQPSKSYFWNGN